MQTFAIAMVASLLVVLFLLALDGLRRQQSQMRDTAILLVLGARRRSLVFGYLASILVLYGMIIGLGCATGFIIAGSLYPVWVLPQIKLCVAGIAVVVLLAALLQCCVLSQRLGRMDISDFLAEERG